MTPLENPPQNSCFACGPANPQGLGIRPALGRDADGPFIGVEHTPRDHETGWPGLIHTGLHYTVLFDASYWAALTHTEKVHVPDGVQSFEQRRLPRTGAPFRVEARVVAEAPVRTRATAFTHDGKRCATLECAWRPQSREQAKRAGLELPDYLVAHMEP